MLASRDYIFAGGPPSAALLCPICQDVFQRPVITRYVSRSKEKYVTSIPPRQFNQVLFALSDFFLDIYRECGHSYCKMCLSKAIQQDPSCPLCRFGKHSLPNPIKHKSYHSSNNPPSFPYSVLLNILSLNIFSSLFTVALLSVFTTSPLTNRHYSISFC